MTARGRLVFGHSEGNSATHPNPPRTVCYNPGATRAQGHVRPVRGIALIALASGNRKGSQLMRFVSDLVCSTCGAAYPAERVMNLCPVDNRPVQMRIDLQRLKRERGADGWWNPERPDLWRFGGLLPLDATDPTDRPTIVAKGEGHTPLIPIPHRMTETLGLRLEVKDEGRHYPGYGGNPTLSFKDRGMALTVSMAKALGLQKLAVPTQGNAGDSLAEYAVAGGLSAAIVMSPDTDLPVLGRVAAYAKLYPEIVSLELVAGTIIDCAKRIREHYVPDGYFSVATFQEPGWRTEGKKTLGLEMAEPRGDRLATRTWKLPDVIVYPTGGGTGVVGMAKAFDELEALGLVDSRRPRMICVQSDATAPIVRAFDAGADDISPLPPGKTVATGLNVAQNVGHINVLRIIRESGGCALAVSDAAIRAVIRDEWRTRRFAWSPEGAATLAALPELADRGQLRQGDWVVLVNTASAEKYMPSVRDLFEGGF
jgi:threonine synthase